MKIRWDIKVSHKVGQIWHGKPMLVQFTRQNCKRWHQKPTHGANTKMHMDILNNICKLK